MRFFLMTAAGICIIAAGVLLARQRFDAAFVVATLGVVAWFLHYRVQMKDINAANDIQTNTGGEGSDENPDK